MAWPKIKNIVILILLGTNLCLLAFTVSREARDYQLQERARSNAISFLRDQGIEVDEEQVPRSMDLMPQYVSRDVDRERGLAAGLLQGEVSVQSRGAEVYRYYNENGSVQFHSNGEFVVQFVPAALPVEQDELDEYAQETLARLGFQGQMVQNFRDEEKNRQSLTFRESWNGIPLLTCQAVVNYEDGCLVSITGGRRLVGEPEEDSASSPITVATALMKFYTGLNTLGDVCSRIDSITPAYTVVSTISDPTPMIPVWCIVTDTGSYQLDTLTGDLSRTLGT